MQRNQHLVAGCLLAVGESLAVVAQLSMSWLADPRSCVISAEGLARARGEIARLLTASIAEDEAAAEAAVRDLCSTSDHFERVADLLHLVDSEITDEVLALVALVGPAKMKTLLSVLEIAVTALDFPGASSIEDLSNLADRLSGVPWTLLQGDTCGVSDELDEMTKDFPDTRPAFDLWEEHKGE